MATPVTSAFKTSIATAGSQVSSPPTSTGSGGTKLFSSGQTCKEDVVPTEPLAGLGQEGQDRLLLWQSDVLGQLQLPPCRSRESSVVMTEDKFGFPWAEARKSATLSISSESLRPWIVETFKEKEAEQLRGGSLHLV